MARNLIALVLIVGAVIYVALWLLDGIQGVAATMSMNV